MGNGQNIGYAVGYGKPPAHTRFKKGNSGKRKGHQRTPLRLQSLEAILINALNSPVVINENQQSRQVTKYETAIMQIVNNAASGKIQFVKLLLELVRFLSTSSERAPITSSSADPAESAREKLRRLIERASEQVRADQPSDKSV